MQRPSLTTAQLSSSLVKTASVLLWLVALVIGVKIFWWLITPNEAPEAGAGLPTYQVNPTNQGNINTSAIKNRALFGKEAEKGAQKSDKNAPVTNLNVRLIGVSASSVPARSAAIIEQRGQQSVYVVGDKLENTSVTIQAIYADRVILNNGGNEESLPLEDIGEQRPAFSLQIEGSASAVTETPANVDQAAERIKANPQSMLDYVDIAPIMQNGRLQGYRLRPGNQPQLFNDAGFKSGDIAIAINGLDLTNMQEAMEAGQLLQNARALSITVLRNDESIELELEL